MSEVMEEGEFKGWSYWRDDPFEYEAAGPFYYKDEENGPVAAFRAQRKHMNANGMMHGGCLMTFADLSLFVIAREAMGEGGSSVTIAFSSEFLDAAREGELIEARGEILRAGGSLVFVRGLVTAEGRPCLNFSGTIKKIRPKA